jgi:U3 small nucleolar RNA-associated protein 20
LKKLFKKNSFEKVKKLLPLVNDWFSKIEKPEMIRTASQVYGLIFEAFDDLLEKGSMKCIGEVMPNIMACLNLVVEEMKAANDVEVVLEDDSVLLRYWDAGYYSLMTLGKIMRHQASFDMCVEWYDELLSILTTLLAHPHQWVRSASSRVFGVLFSRIDGSGLLGEGVLYDLGVKSAVQLQGKHVSLETCTQVVKNLFFIGKTMHANSICDSVVKKDGDGEVEEMTGVKSSSLARLIKKLAYFCRSATKNCEHTRTRLIMVFDSKLIF